MPTLRALLTGRPVVALPSSASALDAARAMDDNRVGALLVTDGDGGQAVGIFTERDLMSRVVVPGLRPEGVRLAEVMTSEMFTASPEDKIASIRRELQSRHIRHLPVVEGERIVGMLSLRDLLSYDLDVCTVRVEALSEYIQAPPPVDVD